MKKLKITGPTKLSGQIKIQGAKNAAMRYAILPLLASDKFTFSNIPDIESIKNLLEIAKLQGAKISWRADSFDIDTSTVSKSVPVDSETFYYTSGGIYAIPILVSRFGRFILEKQIERNDTGGDKIGTRSLDVVRKTFESLGIASRERENKIEFYLASKEPFTVTVPNKSVSVTINAVTSALFKNGKSVIRQRSEEVEGEDVIRFLQRAGAKIVVRDDTIEVEPSEIRGINWEAVSDKNDLVTWVMAAVGTASEISFTNIQPNLMKLEPLLKLLESWQISMGFSAKSCRLDLAKMRLKPVNIIAGQYPLIHTDWQPLISPVLTKVVGESSLVDAVYTNRMRHWEELAKMGARYEYFASSEFPGDGVNPRAVKVQGPVSLYGTQVEAKDVRSGGSLIIAGLMASGKTEISGLEHIERGYENVVGRLRRLHANVKLVS